MSFVPESGGWNDGGDSGFNAEDTAVSGGWEESKASGDARNDFTDEDGGGGESRNTGECYNCGETGHNKAECTNEKVERAFTGTCRLCEQKGHRAADCPSKPPFVCRMCNLEGHRAAECTSARTNIFPSDTPSIKADEAWKLMKAADDEKDLDDFKTAFFAYLKAQLLDGTLKSEDLPDLEQGFRAENWKLHLIGTEKKDLAENLTIVSITGNIGQKFVLTFAWSAKPRNKMLAEGWPKDAEENLDRLLSSGFVVDSGRPLCNNCGKAGHTKKHCDQEIVEVARLEIMCTRCDTVGHRVRDCPQPPVDRNACRNCKQSGHMVSECTEPRSAEGVECKNCNTMGHFARDCPTKQERAPRTCRNCDDPDHISKDCPKPRDWSRVQCKNCDEFGHTHVKCKQPVRESDAVGEVNTGADAGGDSGAWGAGSGGDTGVAGNGWGADASTDVQDSFGGGDFSSGGPVGGGW